MVGKGVSVGVFVGNVVAVSDGFDVDVGTGSIVGTEVTLGRGELVGVPVTATPAVGLLSTLSPEGEVDVFTGADRLQPAKAMSNRTRKG